MAQLVSRHSCVADRLPVVVRFPAGPRVRLKTVDPPKGNGLGQKKRVRHLSGKILWVQEKTQDGAVTLRQFGTSENLAGILFQIYMLVA